MIPEADILDQWAVISDCITKPDESHQAVAILTADMFTETGCRDVFRVMKSLHDDGLPTDINHVIARLEAETKLTNQLFDRLNQSAESVRVATPVSYYAGRLREHHRKRCVRDILLGHHQHLCNGTAVDDALPKLMDDLSPYLCLEDVGKPRVPKLPDDGYRRFPVDALPSVLRNYVRAVSVSVGCDPAFVVLPALAACASAIGNTRRMQLKNDWLVPPILWCAMIGESGTQKSPPMRAVMSFLKDRQQEQLTKCSAAMSQFKEDERDFRRAIRKLEKTGGDLPEEPQRPIVERCIVSDVTLEGLIPILKDNWRGVLLARDELVGWIGSFDRYVGRGSASADAAHWLSIFNGDGIIVDRKTGDIPSVFVPHACVSICGGIQPGILNRALSNEHRENGLLARLLLAYPPRQPKQWRDEEILQADAVAFGNLLSELFALGPATGSDGNPKPALVNLDDKAHMISVEYINRNGEEQAGMSGDLAAAWSKREETAARLALIIHCVRYACGDRGVDPFCCDADSMQAAVVLATWFKDETVRVYGLLAEPAEQRKLRNLVEWIRLRDGRIRSRDLVSGRRDVKTADEADRLLRDLVNKGFARWEPTRGERGRSVMECVLIE